MATTSLNGRAKRIGVMTAILMLIGGGVTAISVGVSIADDAWRAMAALPL